MNKEILKTDEKDAILNRFLEVLYYQIKTEEFNSITNEELDITSKEWSYLIWFSRYPSLSITKIAKKFLVSKATLSTGLKDLIKKGLIKKSTGKDARFLKLKLTTKGLSFVKTHNEIQSVIKTDLLKKITEDDYNNLIRIGSKVLSK